jgi:hypothetical protein
MAAAEVNPTAMALRQRAIARRHRKAGDCERSGRSYSNLPQGSTHVVLLSVR